MNKKYITLLFSFLTILTGCKQNETPPNYLDVQKYTINEEIVRLKSHLKALKAEIAENPTPGRKIDFICQEINREINTIGSKNQFTEVGTMVVTAKNALENIREQARNVE